MNMRLTLLLLLSGITFFTSQAQILEMNWEPNPVIHKIKQEKFLKESAVIISERNQLEIGIGGKSEYRYIRKIHKIVRVNDEKGIEMFNKIKISYSEDNPISVIKARTISPSGKVVELKADAFKDIKTESGEQQKIFAMEGIEKGSEIEYIVYKRQRFIPFGTEYLQDMFPIVENVFELVAPENFIFELKGYNQAKVAKDTLINNKNCYLARTDNLDGLEEEKYASYLSHFARVEYTIAYNTASKTKSGRLYSWDDIMKGLYKDYTTFGEKETKGINKILEANKDYTALTNMAEKISWIEDYVKTNYIQQEYVADEHAEEIEYILKNKITNESGMKQLMAGFYTAQKINFEIGYTTDRFRKPFDYAFMNVDNLTNCLFYFPDTKQYVAPTETFYRSPYIPSLWCNQSGIFTKIFRLGDIVSASAEERKIPITPAEESYHNHDVKASFNQDLDTCIIQMTQTFGGQKAAEIMPLFVLLEKEKRDEQTKEFFKISEKDEQITDFNYENAQFSSLAKKLPLRVSATLHATNSLEKAGNKYLFKVGELIGRQAEMYQEKERQFDIEIPEPHQYSRHLIIQIPTGYKATGLDNLKMNVFANENGKESCKFVSDYELKGNVLDIKIFEIYHDTFTSKSIYEPYRKVINAAADFNKISIVFEKI